MERTQQGEDFYRLGLELGREGDVVIGCGGGSLAQALARCAGCGAALAGGQVRFHDGSCAACGAWLGSYYGAASLFVRQHGKKISFYIKECKDHGGVGIKEKSVPATGVWEGLKGADLAWASARVAGPCRQEAVEAEGPQALTLALERLGYTVVKGGTGKVPCFCSDEEGFTLEVRTAQGAVSLPGGDALSAAAAYASGRVGESQSAGEKIGGFDGGKTGESPCEGGCKMV